MGITSLRRNEREAAHQRLQAHLELAQRNAEFDRISAAKSEGEDPPIPDESNLDPEGEPSEPSEPPAAEPQAPEEPSSSATAPEVPAEPSAEAKGGKRSKK